jgi:hypothetical protein
MEVGAEIVGNLISGGKTSRWAVVAAAGSSWLSWGTWSAGLSVASWWTALAGLAGLAGGTIVAILASRAGLTSWARGTWATGLSWWAWWWARAGRQGARLSVGALLSGTTGGSGWSGGSSWARWAVVSIAAVAAWVSGTAIGSGGSRWSSGSTGGFAWALWRHGQELLVKVSVTSRGSWGTGAFAWGAVFAGLSDWAVGARWALLAGAALSFNLTSGTEEHVKSVLWAGLWDHVDHLLPHVTRARLAVLDLSLDGGLQLLHIVEDHGEGDQAGGDSDRAEDNGAEGDGAERGLALHFVHLFVLNH